MTKRLHFREPRRLGPEQLLPVVAECIFFYSHGVNLQSDENIWLDISPLRAIQRFTGIQRVVLSLAKSDERLRLVEFEPSSRKFLEVSEPPELEFSRRAHITNNWKQLIWLYTMLAVAIQVLRKVPLGEYAEALLVSALRFLFNKFSSKTRINVAQGSRSLNSREIRDLWLFDLPKTEQHLNFLLSEVEADNIRIHIYLYDMIPVDHDLFVPDRFPLLERRKFEKFLSLVSKASSVVFLSEFTKRRYLIYCDAYKVSKPQVSEVLYPPIDTFNFAHSSESLRLLEGNKETTAKNSAVLAVAPLNRRKNLLVVLRAIEKLLDEGHGVELHAVVPAVANLHLETVRLFFRLARKYPGNLYFYTSISNEELLRLYETCDVVVVPSLLEGFGLPVVEAALQGKPCIVAKGSSLEEIADFLPSAVLDPHDYRQWAARILSPAAEVDREAVVANLKSRFLSAEDFVSFLLRLQNGSYRS